MRKAVDDGNAQVRRDAIIRAFERGCFRVDCRGFPVVQSSASSELFEKCLARIRRDRGFVVEKQGVLAHVHRWPIFAHILDTIAGKWGEDLRDFDVRFSSGLCLRGRNLSPPLVQRRILKQRFF